jgi:hypothetical protein
VLTSEPAKKRAVLLLTIAAMGMPWLSWYYSRNEPGGSLKPGPGILILPAAALLLFMTAWARRHYDWALLSICILGMHVPPLARENRAMMVETLEHDFIEPEREEMIRYLRQHYDGKRILIDMGRQAPLVYDLGLNVREFVYNEGGERLWHEALRNPAKQVGWLFSEKGDAIWKRLQVDPDWAGGYSLAVKTESFSLYRLVD